MEIRRFTNNKLIKTKKIIFINIINKMEDIRIFIVLFLALLFLCRISKEGFEDIEVEKDSETENDGSPKDVGGDKLPPPPPPPSPPSHGLANMKKELNGWDKRRIFSSPSAPNFGSLLELKEVQHLNRMFSQRNNNGNVPKMPVDSQMPSLSEGSTVPNKVVPSLMEEQPSPPPMGGGAPLELHMVYADWCGHSQNALSDFEKLVDRNDVKTSSGRSVKFVLTEEKSDGMEEFKGKVKGFPTYMVKDGSDLKPIDVGDRSESSIVKAAEKL